MDCLILINNIKKCHFDEQVEALRTGEEKTYKTRKVDRAYWKRFLTRGCYTQACPASSK